MSQSNRDAAVALALERLEQELQGVDLAARCELHGLGPVEDGHARLRFLDRRFSLDFATLACTPAIDPLSRALTLRYLTRARPLSAGNTALAYRELPGAAFYLAPFRSRTVAPLAAKTGGDMTRLQQALLPFEAEPLTQTSADAAWRIPVLGRVWLELQYWEPDEEFDANCELLFAPAVAELYTADEAAMLGSLLVWGLRV